MRILFICALALIFTEAKITQATNNGPIDLFASFGFLVRLEISIEGQCSVCSASFIAKNWILTAAHCVHNADSIVAYIGPPFEGNCSTGYNISKNEIFVHPSFAQRKSLFGWVFGISHDIAIIKFKFDTSCGRVSRLKLPSASNKNAYNLERASVTQFGSTCGIFPPKLSVSAVTVYASDMFCEPKWRTYYDPPRMNEDRLCVNITESKGICSGDTGGQLIVPSTGELIGIVSHPETRSCDQANERVLFTRISYFRSWINHYLSGL